MVSLKSLESGWQASGKNVGSGKITKNICSPHYLEFEWRKKPYDEKIKDISEEIFLAEGLGHSAIIAYRQTMLMMVIIFTWLIMMQHLTQIAQSINPHQIIYFNPSAVSVFGPLALIAGLIFGFSFSWQVFQRGFCRNPKDEANIYLLGATIIFSKVLLAVWICWMESWMLHPDTLYNIFLVGQFTLFLVLGLFLVIAFGGSNWLLGKDLDFTRML